MNVIEEIKIIDTITTKEKFWDMFIIDCLIGNTDRHNGNWGFLFNKKNHEITFSPIYDCGSCLNPMLEDEQIEELSNTELRNLAINSYSCLRINGKKINYISYIKQKTNNDCNLAFMRVFSKINIDEIVNFINNIECISKIRKDFYVKIIKLRYEILEDIYKSL